MATTTTTRGTPSTRNLRRGKPESPVARFDRLILAALAAAPGDWLMWRRTLDGWGYSPLDQVDRGNVGDLRMVWSRALAPGRQVEGTPLAYGGGFPSATRWTDSSTWP